MNRLLAVVGCLIALALAPIVDAHEIGKTQVVATFTTSGTYQIDIVVDPDALLTRLQILAARDVQTPATREERDRQIAALMPTFAHAAQVRFDGVGAALAPVYQPASAFNDLTSSPSAVRLEGSVPPDALRV